MFRRFSLGLILLVLVGLGCNLPAKLLASPTQVPAIPSPPVEDTAPSPLADTLEPEALPALTQTPSPTPPVEILPTFPVGFTTTSGDGSTVTYFDLSGIPLGIIQTPGMSSREMHVAGSFLGNPQDVPAVFYTYENNGDIKQTINGQVSTLIAGPDISSLKGVPGQNAFVYTIVTYGDTLSTYFYVRGVSGGGVSWVLDHGDPESRVMSPLAAEAENGELLTIFYTLEPWGIGGDIVFPPRNGFFQLNLENMENILILTEDFNPIGLSPDNTFVAYTEANNIGSGTNASITLYDLVSSVMVPVDLAQDSDRGGGYAVFSPDNQYVAWMEGSGWLMAETPNFHSRVRISNTAGTVIADIPDSAFGSVAADPTARWAIPAGWLDGENLLVEVRGNNWNEPALVKVHFDGTNMTYLAPGGFVGFLYR